MIDRVNGCAGSHPAPPARGGWWAQRVYRGDRVNFTNCFKMLQSDLQTLHENH
jgi:hypothetical protein